jgi:predicted nucleic acid-binding protein
VIVVADTSVLLNLCCIRRENLLQRVFREVVVPEEVADEFDALAREDERFVGLRIPEWVSVRRTKGRADLGGMDLDCGERAALSLALELAADAILIDERKGYAAAVELGLKPIGVFGVLLRAKAVGEVEKISPLLDRLENEARFWMSAELRKHVLRLAQEA